jgi:hypothetical protein
MKLPAQRSIIAYGCSDMVPYFAHPFFGFHIEIGQFLGHKKEYLGNIPQRIDI